MLAGFVRTVGREAATTNPPERRALLAHLCGLAALGLGAAAPAREARHLSYRAAQRQRVLAYIEAHFGDRNLSATRAASDLKVSRRGLYDLLGDDERGFAALVSRRRVEECARLLAEPTLDDVSITAIAWRCGFRDLSTFNRRFRAQCGTSPREFRRDRDVADSGPASRSRGSTRPA